MNNLPDFSAVDREYAFGGELGAIYSPERTVFRVWAPLAEAAVLRLYESCTARTPYSRVKMENQHGIWSADITGDLHGVYYTYDITAGGKTRETIDIYARAAGTNGVRGMVCDMRRTDPEGWENSQPVKLEDYTDAVIYELHVRDLSSDESGSFTLRGKFGAFCEKGVVNSFHDRAGLDHIADMGVTHIHLLPSFDYQTVDESDPNAGFNWGYDPLNYNLPEGSYSTDPSRGEVRIREFKQLIQEAHRRNIGVIMDVVYNHTYSTADSPFTKTFADYYYRHEPDGTLSNGSACGNEFASERAMARKFICDSLCFWAEEYKLDGFRFDLMGLLDIETLNLCAERLRRINTSVILYGEGWTGGSSPLPEEQRAMKHNARMLPEFAMFSDDFRDGVKGSVFDEKDCGYVNGAPDENRARFISSMISGGIYRGDLPRPLSETWADRPQQTVNYVEAHDNLTLYDKLKCSMPEATEPEIIAADKMAAALVMLSQGIPFIQAGQELLRSKPSPDGGYVHDSYNSPDSVNGIKWDDVTIHRNVMEYYRGLIAIRRSFPEFRMRTAEEIRSSISWEEPGEPGVIAAHIGGFLLIVNPTDVRLEYPCEKQAVYADARHADSSPLYYSEGHITVEPHSVSLSREQ